MLFMIVNNLCTVYNGLNPISINAEPFSDVVALYADLRRMQIKQEKGKGKLVRRRASDDAGWW